MGCNCGKKKISPNSAMAAARAYGRAANPNKTAVKVRIINFSDEPRQLIGARTTAPYGKRKNGDVIRVWQSDQMAQPEIFEIL